MSEIQRASREQRRQTEALDGLIAPVGIRNGIQCKNWVVDQQKVLSLLIRIPASYGGGGSFNTSRDGFCEPAFSAHIRRFQQMNGLPADGVVDPDGATLKLLKKLAAGGSAVDPHGPNRQAQEYIQYLNELLSVGKKALDHPGLPGRYRSPLALHLTALEKNMTAAGLTRSSVQAPALTIPILVGLAFIALYTAALMSSPAYREAFVRYVRGISKSAVEITQFLLENEIMVIKLVTDYWLFVMMNAATAVLGIAAEVEKYANKDHCKDQYGRYIIAKQSVLEKIRNSKLPGTRISPDVLASAFMEFMASVYDLMDCSGALNKLRTIIDFVTGVNNAGIIKFVVQTVLGRKLVFPFPIPPWVP